MLYGNILRGWISLVDQWINDPVLSVQWLGLLLWHGFDPWCGNFHMPQVKKKKKKKGFLTDTSAFLWLSSSLFCSLTPSSVPPPLSHPSHTDHLPLPLCCPHGMGTWEADASAWAGSWDPGLLSACPAPSGALDLLLISLSVHSSLHPCSFQISLRGQGGW